MMFIGVRGGSQRHLAQTSPWIWRRRSVEIGLFVVYVRVTGAGDSRWPCVPSKSGLLDRHVFTTEIQNVQRHQFKALVVQAAFCILSGFLHRAGAVANPNAGDGGWHTETSFRWKPLQVPADGWTGFTLLDPNTTGVTFSNVVTEAEYASQRGLLNGSGVAIGDYDRDGLADLYFASLQAAGRLYRNLGGFHFRDVTAEAGLETQGRHFRGATFADVNGDGWEDLLVTSTGRGVFIYLNTARGGFTQTTLAAGAAAGRGGMTLAMADVDHNGTLDLYVTNHRVDDIRDRGQVDLPFVNGRIVIPPELAERFRVDRGQVYEYGEPDELYRNDGSGRFERVSWTGGVFLDEHGRALTAPPLDWGLSASFRDLNGDGWPDLYVCNDFWTPDRLWFNDGQGRFRAAPIALLPHTSASSMGVDFADLDGDGRMDFMVVDMLSRDPQRRKRQMPGLPFNPPFEPQVQVSRNTLFMARGDGTFAEIAQAAGVAASEWSWQPLFVDVDLDGHEDLLIPAGNRLDVQDLDAFTRIRSRQHSWGAYKDPAARQRAFTAELLVHNRLYPTLDMPIVAFRNRGDLTFEDRTREWGTAAPGIHQGTALGDLDGDGDLDMVVNNLGAVAGLYRNEGGQARIAIRLLGTDGNTRAIGSRVELEGGPVPMQSREVVAGGRYLSGSEPLLVFAAAPTGSLSATIHWPRGGVSRHSGLQANRVYEFREPRSNPASVPATPDPGLGTWFDEAGIRLRPTDSVKPFDESARQPSLPFPLYRQGAGLVWHDFDADGDDDLMVGGGRGLVAIFTNDSPRSRWLMSLTSAGSAPDGNSAGLIAWRPAPTMNRILRAVSSGSTPTSVTRPGCEEFRAGTDGKGLSAGSPVPVGNSPTATALALGYAGIPPTPMLFIGGGAIPGRYPEAAASQLLQHRNGEWIFDEAGSRAVATVGAVHSALWSDLNGDGSPELVVASDWSPIRVFSAFGSGRPPVEMTGGLGLEGRRGLWSAVTAADVDGDGRMDLLASNWGQNTSWTASPSEPFSLGYFEGMQPGTLDVIETTRDPITGDLSPVRDLVSLTRMLPFLAGTFPSHAAYATSTVGQVLGGRGAQMRTVTATTLASGVFLNRGERFDFAPFPAQAQWSPSVGIVSADFDGNGTADVFLAQGISGFRGDAMRPVPGDGVVLLGDGRGRFRVVPSHESGITLESNPRAVAVGDFDKDGRPDLAVSHLGGPVTLHRNRRATPGLRVRLSGPPSNPQGIGATLRIQSGGSRGRAHEIHAGAGFRSQDSTVPILAVPSHPASIEVRWPGGRTTVAPLPRATEVSIDADGRVSVTSRSPGQ